MTLRWKLWFAQAPLFLVLIALGSFTRGTVSVLVSSQRAFKDNYLSMMASEGMRQAVEAVHGAAALRIAGHVAQGDRKSTRLNSSHGMSSRMPSSA